MVAYKDKAVYAATRAHAAFVIVGGKQTDKSRLEYLRRLVDNGQREVLQAEHERPRHEH